MTLRKQAKETIKAAKKVEHLMTDTRSVRALSVAERTLAGKATYEECFEARFNAISAGDDEPSKLAYNAILHASFVKFPGMPFFFQP